MPIRSQSSRLADQRCVIFNPTCFKDVETRTWLDYTWRTEANLESYWHILLVQLSVAKTAEVLPLNPVDEYSKVDQSPSVAAIIDIERYSTLSKLLYVTAYVLHFIECLKSHERGSKPTGPFTATELSSAQVRWIASCQHSVYSREIASLQKGTKHLPLVRQLRLFFGCFQVFSLWRKDTQYSNRPIYKAPLPLAPQSWINPTYCVCHICQTATRRYPQYRHSSTVVLLDPNSKEKTTKKMCHLLLCRWQATVYFCPLTLHLCQYTEFKMDLPSMWPE